MNLNLTYFVIAGTLAFGICIGMILYPTVLNLMLKSDKRKRKK